MNALDRMAYELADRACVTDIESNGTLLAVVGACWIDIRPLTDRRELCDEMIAMNKQCLAYAEQRGLFLRHPDFDHLVQIDTERAP